MLPPQLEPKKVLTGLAGCAWTFLVGYCLHYARHHGGGLGREALAVLVATGIFLAGAVVVGVVSGVWCGLRDWRSYRRQQRAASYSGF